MASRVDIQQSFQQSSASHNPHHFNTYAGQGSRRSRGNIDVFTSQDDRGKPDTVLHNLIGLDDDNETWDITIVDRKSSRVAKRTQAVVVYVSTATSSLTLMRTAAQIRDLDQRLSRDLPEVMLDVKTPRLSTQLPALGTIRKRSTVLASIQRTLSPRRNIARPSLSTPTSTSSSNPAIAGPLDVHVAAQRLVALSTHRAVRAHPAWLHFFSADGTDDLKNSHVEKKRLKRTVSDQTLHSRSRVNTADLSSVLELSQDHTRETTEDTGGRDGSMMAAVINIGLFESAQSNEKTLDSNKHLFDQRDGSCSTTLTASTSDMSTLPPPTPPLPSSENDNVAMLSPTPETRSPKTSGSRSRNTAVTFESFEVLRVLGKGCAGKVLLVRHKEDGKLLALKAITKQHVLAHRELAHTHTEQAVLKSCSVDPTLNPFIVKLHYSFHDTHSLYLALDFHPGGDLATQLARWGRLGRDRTRFYVAEIVVGLRYLHKAGIIYRDLKPENVLISANGHVVLTDFGLSKDFKHNQRRSDGREDLLGTTRPHWLGERDNARPASTPASAWLGLRRETTTTFCGTAEYLAPELLLGEPYSYEVDAWALGTIAYECLYGMTPFFDEDHGKMYRKVLHDDLDFHESRMFDDDTKMFIRGLLHRDPLLRMSDDRIRRHSYFAQINWAHVEGKNYVPPFVPTLNPEDPTDTSQFDDTFLTMDPTIERGDTEAMEQSAVDEQPGREPTSAKEDHSAAEFEPQAALDQDGRDVFEGCESERSSATGRRTEFPTHSSAYSDSYYGRDSASLHRHDESEANSEERNEDGEVDRVGQDSGPGAQEVVHHGFSQEQQLSSDLGTADARMSTDLLSPSSVHTPATSPSMYSSSYRSLNASHEVVPEEAEGAGLLDDDWDDLGLPSASTGQRAPSARNGGREMDSHTPTLRARGFRDRYRLLVASSVSRTGTGGRLSAKSSRAGLRSPSSLRKTFSRRGSSSTTDHQSNGGEASQTPSLKGLRRFASRSVRSSVSSSSSRSPVRTRSRERVMPTPSSSLLRPEDAENVAPPMVGPHGSGEKAPKVGTLRRLLSASTSGNALA